jgi:YfiH family protein
MLYKKSESAEWLEFEQLAGVAGLAHAVFLRADRDAIQAILGCEKLSSGKQCHGDRVVIGSDDKEECDGIVTQDKGRGLIIHHADCQAAIFYDPILRAVANVHAGWRGNVQNIYAKTVSFMQREVGSKPENLLVCISPSLGPCCGEFRNFKSELPEEFWPFQVKPTYFNLWEIARHQLLTAGILSHHLEIASICTCCNPQGYHSYRRDKTKQRHATGVVII